MEIKNIKIEDIAFGSSIQEIEVPEALKTRIPCGLDYFNAILGGEGFTPSAVTLFTGVPGAGKTTMMLSLADSLQRAGAEVVFNTAEESLYQIKMTCDRLKLKQPFKVGGETRVPVLLEGCDKLREAAPERPFFLIVDSLQCLNDGKYGEHSTNSKTTERSLQMITDYCKTNFCNAIVIGQVTKNGQMAGANVLKHMVDAHIHLSIETKDEDLKGCRVLETQKNRFGGAGHVVFLDLLRHGFREVARVSAN